MNNVVVDNIGELPYAMEEAVNRLRVNIGFLGTDIKKIMVISTFPNEGKSLVTIQLWRQMAEAGIPSVFVDMDLRNSVLAHTHRLRAEAGETLIGTSQYLSGEARLDEVLCHSQFEKGDLIFNLQNAVNPSILFESKRFIQMLSSLADQYRYVFLDCPPLDLVSDGERIGSQCDGALLVVRSGVTPTVAVRASMRQLERAGCPVLGIVLNRAEGSKGGYYGKRYGSYYGSRYGGYGGYYNDAYYGGAGKRKSAKK